jgi:hypothetical protein
MCFVLRLLRNISAPSRLLRRQPACAPRHVWQHKVLNYAVKGWLIRFKIFWQDFDHFVVLDALTHLTFCFFNVRSIDFRLVCVIWNLVSLLWVYFDRFWKGRTWKGNFSSSWHNRRWFVLSVLIKFVDMHWKLKRKEWPFSGKEKKPVCSSCVISRSNSKRRLFFKELVHIIERSSSLWSYCVEQISVFIENDKGNDNPV